MITNTFLPDKGILESIWEGDVTLDQIVTYIRETKQNREYPRKLKIITHAHTSNMLLMPDDLRVIVEENIQSLAQYETIIDAFIANEAQTAALSILYEKFSRMPTYKFKVFSTPEAAMEWLEKM